MVKTYLWAEPPVGTDGDLTIRITHIEDGNLKQDTYFTLNYNTGRYHSNIYKIGKLGSAGQGGTML